MSNGFIYVVDAHFIDKIEEEENILDPSACGFDVFRFCSVSHFTGTRGKTIYWTPTEKMKKKITCKNLVNIQSIRSFCGNRNRKWVSSSRSASESDMIFPVRYSKPKTPPNERFCKFCINQVEDEHHFLFQCPQYNLLRQKYSLINVKTDISLITKLNPKSFEGVKKICLYIKEAFEVRDHPAVHQQNW